MLKSRRGRQQSWGRSQILDVKKLWNSLAGSELQELQYKQQSCIKSSMNPETLYERGMRYMLMLRAGGDFPGHSTPLSPQKAAGKRSILQSHCLNPAPPSVDCVSCRILPSSWLQLNPEKWADSFSSIYPSFSCLSHLPPSSQMCVLVLKGLSSPPSPSSQINSST